MNLKPDETYCNNSWCCKVYKKRENDLFWYLCPECNDKEIDEALKLQNESSQALTVSSKQTSTNKSFISSKKRGEILRKQQKQQILQIIKHLTIDRESIGAAEVVKYITKFGGYDKIRKTIATINSISATCIRDRLRQMVKDGMLEEIKLNKQHSKYKINTLNSFKISD